MKYKVSLAVRRLLNDGDKLYNKIPKYFHLIFYFIEE